MDTVVLLGRLLVSLACVLGVIWVISRRLRRGTKSRGSRLVEVLDRTSLTRSSSVAVVRVGDRALVLGVADAQVSVLGETDLAAAQAVRSPAGGSKRAAHRGATTPRVTMTPARTAAATPAPTADVPTASPAGPLAGSALSPQTWRQTIESLRDLTSRT